jgi:3-deoxy-manno-octulosonate cytidylyltransferase (CMP-KDO synthetase)
VTVHVVIPARLDSTRLPRKPLVRICGVPMIVRVARQAAMADVADVTVAVDAIEVQQVVEDAGFNAVMTDRDHNSGSDRVHEVSTTLAWAEDDLVVNVQGDEPLLPPHVIDALVSAMRERPQIELGTVSEPIASMEEFLDPNAVKVVSDAHQNALYFSRAPIPYPRDQISDVAADADFEAMLSAGLSAAELRRHVGIYAFRVRGLRKFVALADSRLEQLEKLEQLRWLEAGNALFVLAHDTLIPGGVDTQDDLRRVEAILNSA